MSEEQKRRGRPNEESRHISGNVHIEGAVDVRLPRDVVKREGEEAVSRERRENNREKREELKQKLDWITLAFVIIVAMIGALQMETAQKSLKDTESFFQKDQRPYVSSLLANPIRTAPSPVQGSVMLESSVEYVNYGKSPALHERTASAIFNGKDASNRVDAWFARLGDKPLESSGTNQMLYETLLMQGEKAGTEIGNFDSTPGSPYFVAMRFEYFDNFGNRYWTDNCWWQPGEANQGFTRCFKHNEVH